jgi:DoxX-like family
VLGAIALVVPRFPRLKEWVYAGMFFNMTGAFLSHVIVGDPVYHLIVTGSIALLVVASWALRPQSRTVGNLNVVAFLPPRKQSLLSRT